MPSPGDKPSKRSRKKHPATPPAATPTPPDVANLEMEGDRLKVYSLADLLKHKRPKRSLHVASLADVLVPWFEKSVEKTSQQLNASAELWLKLVPPNLVKRTRLLAFHRGTLTAAADNATVRAELDAALRRGLLRQLQTESKGAIYRVKTCVQTTDIPEIS